MMAVKACYFNGIARSEQAGFTGGCINAHNEHLRKKIHLLPSRFFFIMASSTKSKVGCMTGCGK
jgi:hypothetical protein